jgi:hypothetical protein
MLNVILLCVIMLSVVMFSVSILIVITISVIMFNVSMLNGIMPSVIMANVVAPPKVTERFVSPLFKYSTFLSKLCQGPVP